MFKKILLSLIIGGLLFIVTGPFIIRYAEGQLETEELDFDQVIVGEDINKNGFRQIFIDYQGEKTFLTTENTTHSNVSWEDEYITWMSQINANWQIFLHHIPSYKTIQLTNVGNNVNPHISDGKVVWEGQVNGIWQAFIFDSSKIYQITTSNTPIQEVGIEKEHIVYSKKRNEAKGWDVFYHNYDLRTTKKLTKGASGLNPTIKNGFISWETYKNNNITYYEYNIENDEITVLRDIYITTSESTASATQTEGFNVNSYVNFLRSIGQSPTPALKVVLE